MGRILVFSTTECKYCRKAKGLLKECNIPYTEINLDIYPERRKPLAAATGSVTVPQIYFNGLHIGGNDSLQALYKEKGNAAFIKMAQDAIADPVDPKAPNIPSPRPPPKKKK